MAMHNDKADWAKLPVHLSYIREPAERYGALQFDSNIYDYFENRMTEEDRDELIELGKRMANDWSDINAFLNTYSMRQHREAALIYFTIHLLALGNDLNVL